ncbi:MAG: peptidylprolyl isomerase [Chloroflexi bacterium]|nr:peptidylprolyl isomerase [Chloroflexota bacterium]
MKKTKQAIEKPVKRMTQRELSRHQREQRQQRILLVVGAVVLVSVLGILLFGYWREAIHKGSEPIVKVNGQPVSVTTYAKVLGFQQYMLDQQIEYFQRIAGRAQSTSSAGKEDPNEKLLAQYAQQQVQFLGQQRARLEGDTVEQLIDDELSRQEATKRGLTVTAEEVDAEIAREYASSQAEQGTPITNTTQATPTPTATPSASMANEQLRKSLSSIGILSEQEFRRWIIEPKLWREKLEKVMEEEVPRSGEQVRASEIVTETEEQAKQALERALRGEDFATLATELSKDATTKAKGGDLGWLPRGVEAKEIDEALFSLKPGEIYPKVVSSYGQFYVLKVEERAENREISAEHLSQLKSTALSRWLQSQKPPEGKSIEYFLSWEKTKWARDYIAKHLKAR